MRKYSKLAVGQAKLLMACGLFCLFVTICMFTYRMISGGYTVFEAIVGTSEYMVYWLVYRYCLPALYLASANLTEDELACCPKFIQRYYEKYVRDSLCSKCVTAFTMRMNALVGNK